MRAVLTGFVGAVAGLFVQCRHGEPPVWDAGPMGFTAAPIATSGDAPRASPTVAEAPPSRTPPPRDGIALDDPSPRAEAGIDAGALPQTRDMPEGRGPAFEARARALVDAIAKDDPEIAMKFFFPVAAYQQVKDIQNPAADWRSRLVTNYVRDIHALHSQIGNGARFAGAEIDERIRWVEPGGEYNKVGYFRVYGARIRYVQGSSERSFPVSSMISWRGDWYVVHLTGFK